MVLKPVKRRSVSDAVFDQLRDRIVSGDMAVGSQLPGERALSETLGVNRGAVREALKCLAQAGLVSIQHGGGTRVLDYRRCGAMDLLKDLIQTPDGRIDLDVARSALEMRERAVPHMARLAARRGGPDLDRQLGDVVRRLSAIQDCDVRSACALRWEFWTTLAQGCGNLAYQFSFNTLSRLFDRMSEPIEASLATLGTREEDFAKLAEAIKARDEEAAERHARETLVVFTDLLIAALDRAKKARAEAG